MSGCAKRSYPTSSSRATQSIMAAKGMGQDDKKLSTRIDFRVKDCWKRMNTRAS